MKINKQKILRVFLSILIVWFAISYIEIKDDIAILKYKNRIMTEKIEYQDKKIEYELKKIEYNIETIEILLEI